MPKYSVIIPIYNAENYLRDCLNSCLSQSYQDFELILVDDGSKDSSGNICDEYAERDTRVTVIHRENEGVSIARNTGIEAAKGTYITFVDSDDTISPKYFEVLDLHAGKADIIYYGIDRMMPDGSGAAYYLPERLYNGWVEVQKGMLLLKSNDVNIEFYGYTWNKAFKLDIIRKYNIRFIPGLSLREDELFTNEYILHCQSLKLLPNVLYNYRFSNGGLTGLRKDFKSVILFKERSEQLIEKLNNPELRDFQIKHLYHILFEQVESYIDRLSMHMLLSFAKTYSGQCPTDIWTSNTLEWAIWNYYKCFSAKRHVIKEKFKILTNNASEK